MDRLGKIGKLAPGEGMVYTFRKLADWRSEDVLRKESADGREKTVWRFAWFRVAEFDRQAFRVPA
jgi:hypothetical protein